MKITNWFSNNLIFIAMLIIAAYIMYLTLSYNHDVVNAALVGEMIGNFIMVFALWAIAVALLNLILSIFTKKINLNKLATSKYAFLLIFIFIEVSHLYPLLIKQREINNSVDSLVNTVSASNDSDQASSTNGAPPSGNQATISNGSSDEEATLLNKMNQAVNNVNKKYENDMNKLGVEYKSINEKFTKDFTPSSLTTENGINLIKSDIIEYRKFVLNRSALLTNYQNDLAVEISTYNITYKEFWDSYNISKNETKTLIDSLTSTDNQMLDVMTSIIALIENNLNQVKVINNNIVFNNSSINEQYKTLLLNLGNLLKNESEITAEIQNKKSNVINELKEMKQ